MGNLGNMLLVAFMVVLGGSSHNLYSGESAGNSCSENLRNRKKWKIIL